MLTCPSVATVPARFVSWLCHRDPIPIRLYSGDSPLAVSLQWSADRWGQRLEAGHHAARSKHADIRRAGKSIVSIWGKKVDSWFTSKGIRSDYKLTPQEKTRQRRQLLFVVLVIVLFFMVVGILGP